MMPSIFLSHGSPMLALDPGRTGQAWQKQAHSMPTPTAVVVVSPHWWAQEMQVLSAPRMKAQYDFGGFSPELLKLRYEPPGAPDVQQQVMNALQAAGLTASATSRDEIDHGVWVPLRTWYPQADVPVVQISMTAQWHAGAAAQVGLALQGLRAQGILMLGSGSLTHNLRDTGWGVGDDEGELPYVDVFRKGMWDLMQKVNVQEAAQRWMDLPQAQQAHPTDEHLWPLFFAWGAGGGQPAQVSRWHQGTTHGNLAMDGLAFQ